MTAHGLSPGRKTRPSASRVNDKACMVTRRNVRRPASSFLMALTETQARNAIVSTDQFSMARAAAQWAAEKNSGKSSNKEPGPHSIPACFSALICCRSIIFPAIADTPCAVYLDSEARKEKLFKRLTLSLEQFRCYRNGRVCGVMTR